MIRAIARGIEAVTGLVDNIFTSEEESKELDNKRKKLKNALRKEMNRFALSIEDEITKRHQADMASDSWLSKNIRPLSLIWTTGVVTIFAVFDGNVGGFVIQTEYISLMKALMMAQYTFYFGSRALEKYNAIKADKEFKIERERRAKEVQKENIKLERELELKKAKVPEVEVSD